MRHIFIINPAAGRTYSSEKLFREIERLCKLRGIEPLIWISEYPGYEYEMTKRMSELFSGEKIRIYCVGGSGTLNSALNAVDNFENVELASIPIGLSNDILKSYGETKKLFKKPENIIDGRVDMLDIGEVNGVRFIDFINFGLKSALLNRYRILKVLAYINPVLYYAPGIIFDLFASKCHDYEITVDGADYSGRYSFVTLMNGKCMGGAVIPIPDAKPNDGVFDILMVKKANPIKKCMLFAKLLQGKLHENSSDVIFLKAREMQVARRDGKPLLLNCDGEKYLSESGCADISFSTDKLSFAVPEKSELC